jgi:hypothetical protein
VRRWRLENETVLGSMMLIKVVLLSVTCLHGKGRRHLSLRYFDRR